MKVKSNYFGDRSGNSIPMRRQRTAMAMFFGFSDARANDAAVVAEGSDLPSAGCADGARRKSHQSRLCASRCGTAMRIESASREQQGDMPKSPRPSHCNHWNVALGNRTHPATLSHNMYYGTSIKIRSQIAGFSSLVSPISIDPIHFLGLASGIKLLE